MDVAATGYDLDRLIQPLVTPASGRSRTVRPHLNAVTSCLRGALSPQIPSRTLTTGPGANVHYGGRSGFRIYGGPNSTRVLATGLCRTTWADLSLSAAVNHPLTRGGGSRSYGYLHTCRCGRCVSRWSGYALTPVHEPIGGYARYWRSVHGPPQRLGGPESTRRVYVRLSRRETGVSEVCISVDSREAVRQVRSRGLSPSGLCYLGVTPSLPRWPSLTWGRRPRSGLSSYRRS